MLKLVAAKPDAILIAASGTPAALPQRTLKERGYAGKYYQTHGVPITTSCASAARTSKAPAAGGPGARRRATAADIR